MYIDDEVIGVLMKYYERSFLSASEDVAILDVCSSWIFYYFEGYKVGKIFGIGMNEDELKKNFILIDYVVWDLNEDLTFSYADNIFDVVTNTVSVDYFIRFLEVMKEVSRVLKLGGMVIMSFLNRCFFIKVVVIWIVMGDLDYVWIVGAYYYFVGGFESFAVEDILFNFGKMDFMYVVIVKKMIVW